jgi:hypothetical protein
VGAATVVVSGAGNFSSDSRVSAHFIISPTVVALPAAVEGLAYTGRDQDGVTYDGQLCAAEGATARAAGDYVATVSLADPRNSSWPDGTSDPVEVAYSIARADIARAAVDPIPPQVAGAGPAEPEVFATFNGQPLVEGRDYALSYEGNAGPGTASAVLDGRGNFRGTTAVSFRIDEAVRAVEVHRMYNPNSGEHFYTLSAAERDALVAAGWSYEGVGWRAPSAGDDVYRLYNPYSGDHHYTPSGFERDSLVAAGWRYEGVAWQSDAGRRVPLYRDYNPNARVGTHNYTVSAAEHRALGAAGWVAEGIAWYGV